LDEQISDDFESTHHDVFTEVDGGHGRIEERKVWITTDIEELIKKHPRWESLKGIIVVESTREIGDKISYERRYYITSHQQKSAQFIANTIRSHWHVENKLHWQLDVSFDEDKLRLRSGNAAENISLINKIALNLLKNETTVSLGIKNKRLKAGWDNDYMLKVLTIGVATP
jgi:predicted transposase YbfD/YdcC